MSTTPITAHFAVVGLRVNDRKYTVAMIVLTEEEVKAKRFLRSDALVKNDIPLHLFGEQLMRKLRYCRPGSVYVLETNENHTSISYTRQLAPAFYLPSNDPSVIEWDAQHRAIQAHKRRAAQQDKDGKTHAMRVHLAPVRKAYAALPYSARADLLAEVIAYITRGA